MGGVVGRLRALADALPEHGAVMLTRADLLELTEAAAADPEPEAPAEGHTVGELAARFGRSANTIRDWVRLRGLPALPSRP